jgi:hypothetical protein
VGGGGGSGGGGGAPPYDPAQGGLLSADEVQSALTPKGVELTKRAEMGRDR